MDFKTTIQQLPAKFSQQLQTALTEIPFIPLESRFEILGSIGVGGMGAVFKAREKGLDRIVAIKRLLIGEFLANQVFYGLLRFLREAKTLAKLNHQNIVYLHQTAYDTEGLYIVMEYIEGMSLSELLKIRGKLTIPECVHIIKAVAKALEFAHNLGVIHRDIKPGNIMLTGSSFQKLTSAKKVDYAEISLALSEINVKVLDFGLAKLRTSNDEESISQNDKSLTELRKPDKLLKKPDKDLELSVTGSMLGTMLYAPPEQKDDPRNVKKTADIYSLGLVFYQILTGLKPSMLIPTKIKNTFRELIIESINPNPAQRIQTIPDFLSRLDKSIGEEEEFNRCVSGSSKDCEGFLHKYPTSVFRARIQNIKQEKEAEEIEYQKALNGTAKDCTAYLEKYKNGRYALQVKELLGAKENQLITFIKLAKFFGIALGSGVLFSMIFISFDIFGFLLGAILGGAAGFGIYWAKYKFKGFLSNE